MSKLLQNDQVTPEYADKIKNYFKYKAFKLLVISTLVMFCIAYIDKRLLDNEIPSVFTFGGVGLVMSLLSLRLIENTVAYHMNWRQELIRNVSIVAVLLAILKFTVAPYIVYLVDPKLDVDKANFLDSSNFNGNIFILGMIGFALYLCYSLVFKALAEKTGRSLRDHALAHNPTTATTHRRKSGNLLLIMLIVAAAVLTGGGILIVLLLPLVALEPTVDWIGYVFTGAGGVLIAVMLSMITYFARKAISDAEIEAKSLASYNYYVVFIWSVLILVGTYHIAWAIYIFVLTTFWPFKVFTHGVAPK